MSSSQIAVSWTDVTGESSYELQSGASSSGPWTTVATPTANSTGFQHSGLSASTAYCYRLRALNANGPSGWTTAQVCATTPTASTQLDLLVNATTPLTVAPNGLADIPVILDFSRALAGTNLASLSYQLSWNPAHFTYVSHTVGTFGNPIVNASNASAGNISLALFAPTGTSTTFTTLRISLRATGTPVAQSTVTVTATAAGNDVGQPVLSLIRTRALSACIGTPAGVRGDADGDNTISIIDAQQIARYAVGLPVLNPQRLASGGDANGDGAIDIIDAQQIARSVVGLPASPNIGQQLPGGCP